LLTPFLKSLCAPEFLPGLFIERNSRGWHKNFSHVVEPKTTTMRAILIVSLFSAAVFSMSACNDAGEGSELPADSATASTDRVIDSTAKNSTQDATLSQAPLSKDDSIFMLKAADGGMMEVELGQVATQNARNERVKNFGNMMVNDHSGATNELKQIAARRNLILPPAMNSSHIDHKIDLSKKKGADFDKSYMKMMVNDHENDIKEFEKASTDANDAEIRAFATKTLPTLRIHLDSAKAIRKAL
jgi:putative membrane protein